MVIFLSQKRSMRKRSVANMALQGFIDVVVIATECEMRLASNGWWIYPWRTWIPFLAQSACLEMPRSSSNHKCRYITWKKRWQWKPQACLFSIYNATITVQVSQQVRQLENSFGSSHVKYCGCTQIVDTRSNCHLRCRWREALISRSVQTIRRPSRQCS